MNQPLTRRDRIAIENFAQMVRFIARGTIKTEEAAQLAVAQADMLEAELDRTVARSIREKEPRMMERSS
jgi:hypothetical protein